MTSESIALDCDFQFTVPAEIVQHLQLTPESQLMWNIQPEGTVTLTNPAIQSTMTDDNLPQVS